MTIAVSSGSPRNGCDMGSEASRNVAQNNSAQWNLSSNWITKDMQLISDRVFQPNKFMPIRPWIPRSPPYRTTKEDFVKINGTEVFFLPHNESDTNGWV